MYLYKHTHKYIGQTLYNIWEKAKKVQNAHSLAQWSQYFFTMTHINLRASHSQRDTKTHCMYSSQYDSNNFGSLAITDLKHTGGLRGQMVKNRD